MDLAYYRNNDGDKEMLQIGHSCLSANNIMGTKHIIPNVLRTDKEIQITVFTG